MRLLAPITQPESDQLWWKLVKAAADLGDEIQQLSKLPKPTRDFAYGPDVMERMQATQEELLDIIAWHVNPAPSGPDPATSGQ